MSYSVKFGLLPATSLPQANLHKNIGYKTPSPLTVQDSKGLSPLAGREGEGGSKGGRGNPALNGVSSPSLKEKTFIRSLT